MTEKQRVYRSKKSSYDTPLSRYEAALDEYKALFKNKIHPSNRTASYEKNVMSIFNRLLVAADGLEEEEPGKGIFGLLVFALNTNLTLKDEIVDLRVQNRDLEKRIRRLEKQNK